jgi:hypothetical protein
VPKPGLPGKSVTKKRAAKKVVVHKAGDKPKRKAAVRARSSAPIDVDFAATFEGLKQVMAAFLPELRVAAAEPQKFYLVTKSKSWQGQPMFFGAVMMGKAYVSYP